MAANPFHILTALTKGTAFGRCNAVVQANEGKNQRLTIAATKIFMPCGICSDGTPRNADWRFLDPPTPPKLNSSPLKNDGLEDDPFLLGIAYFQGLCSISGVYFLVLKMLIHEKMELPRIGGLLQMPEIRISNWMIFSFQPFIFRGFSATKWTWQVHLET